MKKTLLLLFPTMALALLLAAGTAWAALPAPTVLSTVPPNGTSGVDPAANITATFSEAMSTKSLGICNHCTSTTSSKTFYLLQGNFTGSTTKNPPRFCSTPPGTACPTPVRATVSYNAGTNTATLNPTPTTLLPNTTYTAVVEGTADGDFVAVKDTGGTPMATDYIFHFTTSGPSGGGI
jgi:Bacterial Ig-like domain